MTVVSWLESRTPPAPEALRARLLRALGDDASESGTDAFTACLHASATLLQHTLTSNDAGRDTALDLLAADALITYAFESAANDLKTLDERAAGAMRQLGALLPTSRPNT